MRKVVLDVPPDEAIMLSKHLFNLRDRFGIPKNVTIEDLNETIWKFVTEIVRVFKIAYPLEWEEWRQAVEYNVQLERDVGEAVKGGGYIPISYPERLFMLFKVFLPKIRYNDKSFTRGLISRIGDFKRTSYRL